MKALITDFDSYKNCCKKCGKKIEIKTIKILGITRNFEIICDCLKDNYIKYEKDEKERKKREKLSRFFKQSRLGKRFENSYFEKIKVTNFNKECINSLIHFSQNFKERQTESFILSSHPGTGKTLFVCAVVNALIKRNISAIFLNVPDLLMQIRSTYNSTYFSNTCEFDLLKGLSECDLLILDDLGVEKNSNWTVGILYQIINSRYNNHKSIIITTNYNTLQLKENIGIRIFSRLIEMIPKENRFNLEKEKDWRIENG